MALRKVLIPYSDFQANTKILSQSLNTNFDELEYCFNQLYDDYVLYKTNTYLKTDVDAKVLNDINTAKTEIALDLTNATNTLSADTLARYNDNIISIDNCYASTKAITALEITQIING